MTSSVQIFRHFFVCLLNAQGIALAGLAPKLRQIASIRKKREAQWNGQSGVSSQIWPQANRFGARVQNVLRSSTIFQTLSFSTITSELFVLQQRIWHHRVSLVETNRAISNFAKKNIKIWPPAKFGITGQIRSKLVILGIIRFGATRQAIWCQCHSSFTFGSKVTGKRVISPIRLQAGSKIYLNWGH